MNYKIINGDCIDKLKDLEDNSIDSIVTDPPYGLSKEPNPVEVMKAWCSEEIYKNKSKGFMNQEWDSFVPSPAIFKEAIRVLKPGGHILCFAGTRTVDWMSMSLRFAGFEIRDMIAWVHGMGFPKSHNISKNISKSIDKTLYNEVDWKTSSKNTELLWKILKNANPATQLLKKNLTEVGNNTRKRNIAPEDALQSAQVKRNNANVYIVDENSKEALHMQKEKLFVALNVEQNMQTSKQNVINAEKQLLKIKIYNPKLNTIIVVVNVQAWLKEKTKGKIKEEEVQKILLGKKKLSNGITISANFAVLIENLKDTILNQLKHTQNLGTMFQTELLTVTNATITKSTMECLISYMADIAKKSHEGWGSNLKPALEPIILARKPLSEKTIVKNVLKHGTGGINIDGCRVGLQDGEDTKRVVGGHKTKYIGGNLENNYPIEKQSSRDKGRFPANFIHDGSEEVLELFPNSKSSKAGFIERDNCDNKIYGKPTNHIGSMEYGDEGSCARFFYCGKASKRDRNEGCENLEFKESGAHLGSGRCKNCGKLRLDHEMSRCKCGNFEPAEQLSKKGMNNNHPTVKPTDLMRYLVRLITPPNGTVLDPFMGSGSTGKACAYEKFDFIGIELDEQYCKIAEARIKKAIQDNETLWSVL